MKKEVSDQIKSKLPLISVFIVALVIITTFIVERPWLYENKVIMSDVKTYYSYLPATFIYHDLTLSFLKDNEELQKQFWPVKQDGKFLIVTSCGLSMLYTPFFLLAHLYAGISGFEADGFSAPYKFALVVSSLVFLISGLYFLKKTLEQFFSKFITSMVVLIIPLGTNLFYYSVYEPALTHVYSFALISAFIYANIKWHKLPDKRNSIALGLLFGVISLIRPTNVLILLFFLFWDITTLKDLKTKLLFFINRIDLVVLMAISAVLVWIPQFIYWKIATGNFIFYSYGAKDAGFFFLNPQILNILISYKKGWFVYTPVMAVAFAGIFFLWFNLRKAALSTTFYMLMVIYVLSSWWSWWYGGGFGLRAFVDSYAVMAIPLAAVLKASLKKKAVMAVLISILIILSAYNLFQVRQYNNHALHWWWMNKDTYWETFLKSKPTAKYWSLLTYPDYVKARKGIYEEITYEQRVRRYRIRSIMREFEARLRNDSMFMEDLRKKNETSLNEDTLLKRYVRTQLDEYIYQNHKEEIDSIATTIKIEKEKGNTSITGTVLDADSLLILKAIDRYKSGK